MYDCVFTCMTLVYVRVHVQYVHVVDVNALCSRAIGYSRIIIPLEATSSFGLLHRKEG